jgi:transcriptional regulator with XRE-family HTH domain
MPARTPDSAIASTVAPRRPRARAATKKPAGAAAVVPVPAASESTLFGVARDLRHWADSILGMAGAGASVAMSVARPLLSRSISPASLRRGGAALKDIREAAGLSVRDLAEMIDLRDTSVLDLMESGKVAIPFEIVLRLAAVFGRNDPIPFILRLVRQANPTLAKTLEELGIDRLMAQVEREREFLNLYRSQDTLRGWSDKEFAGLLSFVGGAVDMAIAFRGDGAGGTAAAGKAARGKPAGRGSARTGKPAKRPAAKRAASKPAAG